MAMFDPWSGKYVFSLSDGNDLHKETPDDMIYTTPDGYHFKLLHVFPKAIYGIPNEYEYADACIYAIRDTSTTSYMVTHNKLSEKYICSHKFSIIRKYVINNHHGVIAHSESEAIFIAENMSLKSIIADQNNTIRSMDYIFEQLKTINNKILEKNEKINALLDSFYTAQNKK